MSKIIWWKIASLAYAQLYMARELATKLPTPWEKYLPEMKNNRSIASAKRGQHWHIRKQILGKRLRESTGAESVDEAEVYLARRTEEIRHVGINNIWSQIRYLYMLICCNAVIQFSI
jgi:hypothetical protein